MIVLLLVAIYKILIVTFSFGDVYFFKLICYCKPTGYAICFFLGDTILLGLRHTGVVILCRVYFLYVLPTRFPKIKSV